MWIIITWETMTHVWRSFQNSVQCIPQIYIWVYVAFVVNLQEFSSRMFCGLTVNFVALEQWFSTRGDFASHCTLAMSRNDLAVTPRGGRVVLPASNGERPNCSWISHAVQDSPPAKNYLALNVNCGVVEKPCSRVCMLSKPLNPTSRVFSRPSAFCRAWPLDFNLPTPSANRGIYCL